MAEESSSASRVRLGRTDLWVSRLCQGTAFRHLERNADDPLAEKVLRHCLEAGVNFYDSAYAYGWGGSEELLGKVLAGRREEAVICTKVPPFDPPGRADEPGAQVPFTEDFLRDGLDGSLKRLGTDYIDLFLVHWPDGVTPPDEICRSMETLVQTGKIRHWGVSNHEAGFVRKLWSVAKKAGTSPPVAVEDYYNVAGYALNQEERSRTRELEREMFPVVRECGIAVLAYSPMDAGQLAPAHRPEPGSPMARMHATLDAVAADMGVSRAQVCVAWVLASPEVTSVLGGAESLDHVDEMLAGAALVLPAETKDRLDAASAEYSRGIETSHNGS